jgi:Mycolic acid cyclopropane synthetase
MASLSSRFNLAGDQAFVEGPHRGGMCAAPSSGPDCTDIEILGLHHGRTLAAWHDRFVAHRDDVERICDASFVRMWEFHLACSQTALRHPNLMVFQIQMARRHDAVPITRDQIMRAEARLSRISSDGTARRGGSPAMKNSAARGAATARHSFRHSQGPP